MLEVVCRVFNSATFESGPASRDSWRGGVEISQLREPTFPRSLVDVMCVSPDARDHVRSREIGDSDIARLADLLGRGLGYPSSYYLQILERLGQRAVPSGFPRYGYLLEAGDTIVGAILLIFTEIRLPDSCAIRCHVTAWYVEPSYRLYGAIFFAKALNHKEVTYLNISARPSAQAFLKLHGFQKYADGQFISVPALSAAFKGATDHVDVVGIDTTPNVPFDPLEQYLAMVHSKYGCLCLWCITSEQAYPFVFRERYFKGVIPSLQLVYCRDVKDFVRFARPIGRFLAHRGRFLVRIDANGPIQGLFGKYFDGMEPRYFKGAKPRLGDLAYTQFAMAPFIRRKQ
jgi:hypothetical protein